LFEFNIQHLFDSCQPLFRTFFRIFYFLRQKSLFEGGEALPPGKPNPFLFLRRKETVRDAKEKKVAIGKMQRSFSAAPAFEAPASGNGLQPVQPVIDTSPHSIGRLTSRQIGDAGSSARKPKPGGRRGKSGKSSLLRRPEKNAFR